MLHSHGVERPEPRWPAVLAIFAALGLHFVLPAPLRLGRPFLVSGVVALLVASAYIARWRGARRANELAGYAIIAVLTTGLLYGLFALVSGLLGHTEAATDLLRAAAVLWAINCIVFAIWYWRLDAGGPNARDRHVAHTSGAFLFPQMAAPAPGDPIHTIAEVEAWRPGFVDYLFVAFTTSTAFSPTDVPVLSRWAKGVMMLQSVIALATVALIVGRAVNIL